MNKKVDMIALMLSVLSITQAFTQSKYDHVWPTGKKDLGPAQGLRGWSLDFNHDTMRIVPRIGEVEFDRTTAALCPEDHGDMVHKAQSVLMMIDPDYVPYNTSCVESIEQRKRQRSSALSGVSIYPNPASDRITISDATRGSYDVRLLSAAGQELISLAGKVGMTDLDTSHIPPGSYILEVNKTGEERELFKVVIIR